MECNFVRSHSFYGLCGENYFKIRLEQEPPNFKYDFPPYVLFDQKATLVLPFWEKTRNYFSDAIRDMIIFSSPLLSNTLELESGEKVSIEEFSNLPRSKRDYYLKYAGSDVSINWGSRAIYRLSNLSSFKCKQLLETCLKDSRNQKIWMIQKAVSEKKPINYWERDGSKKELLGNAKYSCFYGPYGLIGSMGYYRNHYKVHGQSDTVVSLLVPTIQ